MLAIAVATGSFAQAPQFGFPHHTTYASGTIKPNNYTQSQLDQQVKDFYTAWKARYLKQGCVSSQYYIWYNDNGDNGNAITVSEAIGYGMVIEALMAGYDANARTYFDGLYNWYKAHPSSVNPVLMNWQQKKTNCASIGDDAATDGDLDAAFGLLLADKQWGSNGAINYLQASKDILAGIKVSEVYAVSKALQLGDWAHNSAQYKAGTRPSDFMFDHLRRFRQATGDKTWTDVLNECYSLTSIMQQDFSPSTGLIPDFIDHTDASPAPAAANYLESKYDGAYNYNACRVPWHLGCDFVLNGDNRAKQACNKINTWIKATAGNNSHNIRSGFYLNGNNLPGNNYEDLSFIAPFGVSAMVKSSNQAWLNNIWSNIIGVTDLTRDGYYGNTIKMICMIIMSGNMWAPNHTTLGAADVNNDAADAIMVTPNPSQGKFELTVAAVTVGDAVISVVNPEGVIVYHSKQHLNGGKNTIPVVLTNPIPGLYAVLVKTGERQRKGTVLIGR